VTSPAPDAAEQPSADRDVQGEARLLSGPLDRTSELLRVARISREFIRGFRKLHFLGPCVTVFGSTHFAEGHPYYDLGQEVGRRLAKAGFTTMTGGGPGLMEAANRGAKEAGGRSVGCNIVLPHEQAPNAYLDEMITFQHFYVRKVMLVKYSYAFIALPGGLGTLDEMFEIATLVQTSKVKDFPIVLMPSEFWCPLLDFMRNTMLAQGTVSEADISHLELMDSPALVVDYIHDTAMKSFGLTYGAPAKRRWFLLE
jgi:uncharacterized protein (TIGR00730 family)